MTQKELLQNIKNKLRDLYGSRFRGLVLFGSVARGAADEESDIDLLCLLDGPVSTIDEIDPIIEATSDLKWQYPEKAFSIKAVDVADYDDGAYPLVIEAKREGLTV